MAVVGLWHGAAWGFVLWGFMHGVYLASYRAFENWRGEQTPQPLALRIALRLITLCAIVAAWVPFRAVSLEQAMTMLKSMFGVSLSGFSFSVNFYLMVLIWCVWIALEPTFNKLLAWIGEPIRRVSREPSTAIFCALSAMRFSFCFLWLLMIVIHSSSTSSSEFRAIR